MPNFPVTRARADRAVPAGRVGYDLDADRLLLHTFQTEEALGELLSTGQLIPDPSRAEPLFADAYGWMLREMDRRLPTSGEGALWFWARITRDCLVDSCRNNRSGVLLTCRIPRERVLLSHFWDWHCALNGSPHVLELPGESDDDYAARRERIWDELDDRKHAAGVLGKGFREWPEDVRRDLERGWEHFLDPANLGRWDAVQATAHILRAEDVMKAVRLTR
ncbi:DUF3841 domain-containing protein [Arthrobacter sp. ISL-85]|uniref:DUF3841 domain-containing protein n=1 Tax=Arthrobacter sp. ISL-85 TaxID=2819115 RepID=UPI001BE666F6|nr:DUF3841 domain-containing protein [Arthrobacter sp. ISL-85]MBT2568778.1 DUF3841 domain-containing protein [Arthrobacter sp. ISL-85]